MAAALILGLSSSTLGFSTTPLYDRQGLSQSERERAAVVVGSGMSLDTLAAVQPKLLASIVTQPTPQPSSRTYAVKPGDTLSAIADSYGLHIGTIMLANPGLTDTNAIEQGDELAIPTQDASADDLAKEYAARAKRYASVALAEAPAAARKQAASAMPAAAGGVSFQTPLDSYTYISQPFSRAHSGMDYATPNGTPVKASASGCVTVTVTGWNGGYGSMIKMDNGGGYGSLYGHLSRFAVAAGTCVERGTVIAYSGSTGHSTGPHLHFEIRINDVPVNPAKYVH